MTVNGVRSFIDTWVLIPAAIALVIAGFMASVEAHRQKDEEDGKHRTD